MQNIRPLRLPNDFDAWIALVRDGFQYPENPAWNLETDEVESTLDTLRTMRRAWPVMALMIRLSADVRDMANGFVAEVDGQPAGTILYQRRGSYEWLISDVVVLPAFRRRGLARALVQAALANVRRRGGRQAVLDVIDGNLPAQQLYLSLGFEPYSGSVEFMHELSSPATTPTAGGFTHAPLPRSDWQTRYDLAQRITPEAVARYTPVRPGNFRRPRVLGAVFTALARASGELTRAYAVRDAAGTVVALGTLTARTRRGGVNKLTASVDPAHPAAAEYLLALLLNELAARSRGQRVFFDVPVWQPTLLEAAEALGAKRKYQLQRMGLKLNTPQAANAP